MPLAVSVGDPAGIGPEIIAKAWERRDVDDVPCFFAVGDCRAVRTIWSGPIEIISNPGDAAAAFSRALPILRVANGAEVRPGEPDFEGARSALDALELAVGIARSGAASGLVTGPVSKAQLYSVGFSHPGQTEFIAERCGVATDIVAMMLVAPDLRTVPVTIHVPLKDISSLLSVEKIVAKARTTARGLQRQFGIEQPRLAIAGLNPHAGEQGTIGSEEIDIIIPAIDRLLEEGLDVFGPVPADTMFSERSRQKFDAAICMYHDQALIPVKTLAFEYGVNMTLGLPIVRTSPDHGTAFDRAGKNEAHPGAMIAALKLAATCAVRLA